jgi:hypothetical protein
MINSTTYEYFSDDLEKAGDDVVYDFMLAIVALNKAIINDPGNLSRAKIIYKKKINKIAKKFKVNSEKWVDNKIAEAYIKGLKSADAEIKSIGGSKEINKIVNGASLIKGPPPIAPIPEIPGQVLLNFEKYSAHTEFFGVFRAAAYYSLEDKPFQIMRKADDIYRQVAVEAGEISFKESDIITRRKYSQKLLDSYAKKGLQSITYRNGRRVSIDTYCEMLGRTLTGRCALQASINRYVEKGFNLGIVSAHFRSCDLCAPYEGQVLSLDGMDKRYPSIWDAETQGLFHAQCKHNISPFFEGLTPEQDIRVDRAEQTLIDKHGYNEAQKITYAAQQKQRYIERKIREFKRREITSLDEVAKKRAKNKISSWQKKQREHLKENTFLPRKYSREQIKKAR